MVQILRDQTRQYVADQSAAVKQQNITSTIQDWSNLAGTAKNVIGAVDAYNKGKKALEAEKKAGALNADKKVINQEIGNQANQSISDMVSSKYTPEMLQSESGRAQLERDATAAYQPYIDQMQSEEGKDALRTELRSHVDKLIGNANTATSLNRSAKAKVAAANLREASAFDAKKRGIISDYAGLETEGNKSRDVIVEHEVKSMGMTKEDAEAMVDSERASQYFLGKAEGNPRDFITQYGDDDALKEMITADVKAQKPDISKKELDAVVKFQVEKVKSERTNDELDSVVRGGMSPYAIKEKQSLYQQKQDQEALLRTLPKGGSAYKDAKSELKNIQSKIDNLDTSGGRDLARQDINNIGGKIARVAIKKQQADELKAIQDSQLSVFKSSLNPNSADFVANDLYIKNLTNTPVNQSYIGESKLGYTPINKDVLPLSDKVQKEKLIESYNKYSENRGTYKEQNVPDFIGTNGMMNSLQKLLDMPAGQDNEVEVLQKSFDAINEAYKAPITQKQLEQFNDIIFMATQDRAFGADVGKILKDSGKFAPDTSWMANSFASSPSREFAVAGGDTTKNAIRRSDVDTAQKRYDAETNMLYQNSMSMIADAGHIEDKQERAVAMQQINDYMVGEKKRIYNDMVGNYGIDLEALDNQLDKKGYAFTQVGFKVKEYKGRLDDGTPIFKDAIKNDVIKTERDRLNRILTNNTENKGE